MVTRLGMSTRASDLRILSWPHPGFLARRGSRSLMACLFLRVSCDA